MKNLLVVSKVSFKKRMVNKRKTIFININGSREDVPEELAHLLDYLKKDSDGWVYGAAGTARAGNPARYGMEG